MTAPHLTLAPGLTPLIHLGIGDTRSGTGEGIWDVSRWDQGARWAGSEPTWLDVSCHVVALDTHAGRLRAAARFDTGTATFTMENADGWADVLVAPSAPATLALRPGRPIRFGVDDGTGARWLWRGFVDVHAAAYDGLVADADTIVLSCVDALGEVGRVTPVPLTATVGDGEGPTARIGRILDACGWRSTWRALDPSNVPLLGTLLNAQAIDLLGQTADTAGGSVFGDTAGRVVFRNRDWQTFPPTRPYDAVVGNLAGATACPTAVTVQFARSEAPTRTMVNYSGATTGPVVRDDLVGQTLYGIETYQLVDAQSSDSLQLAMLADRLLATMGLGGEPRIGALTLDAANPGAAAVMLRACDPTVPSYWRVAFSRAGRSVYDQALLVAGVDHHIDSATWTAAVALDDADPWRIAGGRWDQAAWDRATWSAGSALADVAAAARRLLAEVTA